MALILEHRVVSGKALASGERHGAVAGLRPSHTSRPKVSLFAYRPAVSAGAFDWSVNDGLAKLNRYPVLETCGRTWAGSETRAQRVSWPCVASDLVYYLH